MFKIIMIGIVTLCLIIGIWGIYFEPYKIRVENVEIEIKNLPASFKDLKIVHLSDLHSYDFGKREKKVLELLDLLKPDFIFITGDLVSWDTRELEKIHPFWKELATRPIVIEENNKNIRTFAVYGNHEHRNPKFKKIGTLLKQSGIEILVNESKKLKWNNEYFYLIGLDDPHDGYADLDKALKDIDPNFFKILLAHSPEILQKVKEKISKEKNKVDLILTGHTHGGHINIPLLVDIILPLKGSDKRYKNGLFKENSFFMYVNRGIGLSGIPIRLNSFPEIAIITLK